MYLASPLILDGMNDEIGIRQGSDGLLAYNIERESDGEEILEAEVFGKGQNPLKKNKRRTSS